MKKLNKSKNTWKEKSKSKKAPIILPLLAMVALAVSAYFLFRENPKPSEPGGEIEGVSLSEKMITF